MEDAVTIQTKKHPVVSTLIKWSRSTCGQCDVLRDGQVIVSFVNGELREKLKRTVVYQMSSIFYTKAQKQNWNQDEVLTAFQTTEVFALLPVSVKLLPDTGESSDEQPKEAKG